MMMQCDIADSDNQILEYVKEVSAKDNVELKCNYSTTKEEFVYCINQ